MELTFDEALRYLLSLGHETLAIKLGLENVRRLLDALGRPEESFPAVQIAGTNGKGSTAAMLDAMLRAARVKTGLYTSPHLVSITERVKLDGRDISRAEFARQVARVREASMRLRDERGALPSFFEQVTAVALCAFRDAAVDLAILETGLGGRLDATTAAEASVVAVTPVALDHQEYLGTTLREIAAEKAAIIRPGCACVVAPQPPAALEVILARCRETNVAPRFATEEITVEGATGDGRLRATFRTAEDVYEGVALSLRGRHQLSNAATAIALAETLRARGFAQLTRESIVAGLERAEHQGRLELVNGPPALLLDGAHNAAAAAVLRAYLDEFARGGLDEFARADSDEFARAPLTLVFGAMRDKDLAEIAGALFPAADRLILTAIDNPRAAAPEALRALVPASFDPAQVSLAPSSSEALRLAREVTPRGGLVCVTGSLYLVGEVKSLLAPRA